MSHMLEGLLGGVFVVLMIIWIVSSVASCVKGILT
jgi:hypothetical protein